MQKFVCDPELVSVGKENSRKGEHCQHFIL